MDKYTTTSTSFYSAKIDEPIVLYEKDNTRRIFLARINDARTAVGETVAGCIIHQRKKGKDTWEDVEKIPLSKLKGGEGVKLDLDSCQTKKLYDGLTKIYQVSKKGVAIGKHQFAVAEIDEVIKVPKDRRDVIQKLIDQNYSEEVWQEIAKNDPDLATRLSLAELQQSRVEVLKEFENSLKENMDEEYWQGFFNKNQWIFGYGLKYKFLNLLEAQPTYGQSDYLGKGSQRGDFLLNTAAEVKFTVLVEIKKPTTPLVTNKKYRNGVYLLSDELTGAISQLQVNCQSWQKNSDNPENIKKLLPQKIFTINPKGIIVIGNMKDINGQEEKIKTFETFRNYIINPEVITFDELFERAKFIVEREVI